MVSLRPVGSITLETPSLLPPTVLPHPSEAAVILVSGSRANEHDSFTGACNAQITTPVKTDGPFLSVGGGDAVELPRLAATTVGEGGKVLLVHFLHRESSLAVSDLTRGIHRGFVPLRLVPAKAGNKGGGSGGIACMAGSCTPVYGLVFLGGVGLSAV
ncbi:unnamed protein product, partial [Choristocarpus tenellus]